MSRSKGQTHNGVYACDRNTGKDNVKNILLSYHGIPFHSMYLLPRADFAQRRYFVYYCVCWLTLTISLLQYASICSLPQFSFGYLLCFVSFSNTIHATSLARIGIIQNFCIDSRSNSDWWWTWPPPIDLQNNRKSTAAAAGWAMLTCQITFIPIAMELFCSNFWNGVAEESKNREKKWNKNGHAVSDMYSIHQPSTIIDWLCCCRRRLFSFARDSKRPVTSASQPTVISFFFLSSKLVLIIPAYSKYGFDAKKEKI